MENKKFIGMNKNVVLGLSYILFPFAIVALAVDHQKMDRDDKLDFAQSLAFEGIGVILGIVASILEAVATAIDSNGEGNIATLIIGLVLLVIAIPLLIFWIIALVRSFKGKHYEMPICYGIAKKFVKENTPIEEVPVEEAEVEVVEEEAAEETPAEETPAEEEKAE